MWRFWNNIPRAFRQHVYNPRPSAGRCVEEEQEATERRGCPFSGRRRASHETGDVRCCSAKVLHRLLNKRQDRDKDGHYADKNQQHDTGKDGGREWWKSCQRDWWKMLEGTNRMLEAISVGTAMLWGSDGDKYKRKSKLLYRILFALPGSGTTIKSVNGGVIVTPSSDCTATASAQMAIKDAAGAEHDAAVNLSKTETLDSALEEFQTMCTEYTAQSESLLGLHAAQKGDMDTAVKHLRSSCMLGNSSACFNLGLCYETGSGVTQNIDKAQHFYKMAVKGGNILALYNLGLMYMNGCDCSNIETSMGAAAECGCTRAEGLNLLEKAARLGLAEAQTYLGIHHMEGEQNVAKAVSYFRAAAEQNDTEAKYFLGVCYENGWGVEVNECRAAHLYALAASAGHATATFNLAVFNEQGQGGLPEDKVTAKDLYKKAAERGSDQAKERLEEIQASQAAAEVWQEKINTFRQLYQQYHKDEGFTIPHHHESTSLSPSASSPNLTEYLHQSFSYILGDQNAHWDKGHHQLFDPGGGEIHSSNDKRIVFQLGHDSVYDEGSDDVSFKSSPDQSFESEMDDEEFYMSPSLRKSRTVPNFSVVMCNVCY